MKIAESDQNGKYGVSQMVDEMDARPLDSQRLLDPSATPTNLKEFAFGVGIPMPTRTCTRETTLALRSMVFPMFGNPVFYCPDSLEVGDARNEMVRRALDDGVEWLFFLDYDVAPPPNALVKLLSLNTDISSGVYHLKGVPSYPLIYVKGWKFAFEDYEVGDLIKADGCGMGCTLIRMDVFRKIKEPWFKTVPGYSTVDCAVIPHLTEDIYFCNKARAAGYDIIVDTMVQADHVDWKSGIVYHLATNDKGGKKPTPGWTYRVGEHYVTETVADVDHPGQKWAEITPPVIDSEKNPPLDLGCGDRPQDGFLGVDLYAGNGQVVKKDMRDLSWYRKEYGLAPYIFSSHSLEHVDYGEVPGVFREWVNTLEPGGMIQVTVPDAEKYMRSFVERIDREEDAKVEVQWLQHGLYGEQVHEGQYHKAAFTKRILEQLAKSCGLVDVEVKRETADGIKNVVPESSQLTLVGKRGK